MRRSKITFGFFALLLGCGRVQQERESADEFAKRELSRSPSVVLASYYGGNDGFDGRITASGERFDSRQLTAAHRTYPMGTKLHVTNPKNQRSVIVRVNDRGPYAKGRELDLSRRAAEELGLIDEGIATVQVRRLSASSSPSPSSQVSPRRSGNTGDGDI